MIKDQRMHLVKKLVLFHLVSNITELVVKQCCAVEFILLIRHYFQIFETGVSHLNINVQIGYPPKKETLWQFTCESICSTQSLR